MWSMEKLLTGIKMKIIRINVYIVETTKLEKDDRSNTSRSEWSTPHVN